MTRVRIPVLATAAAVAWTTCARAEGPGGIPIRFRLDSPGLATIVIEDEAGNRVRNLVAEARLPSGEDVVWWDGFDEGERDSSGDLVRRRVAPGRYRARGLVHDGVHLRYEFPLYGPGDPPWKTKDGRGGWLADHSPPADVLYLPARSGSPYGGGRAQLLVCSTSGETGEEFVWLDEDGRRLYGRNEGFWGGTHLARDLGPRAIQEHAAYVFISGERDPDNDTMEVRAFTTRGDVESVAKITFPHDSVKRFKTDAEAYATNGLAVRDGIVAFSFTHHNKVLFADARTKRVVGEVALPSPRALHFDHAGRLLVVMGRQVKRFVWKAPATLEGEETVIADGLDDPRRVIEDERGRLYVSDGGTSHQVKVFDRDGKLLRAIGRPGGPQFGLYDDRKMSFPTGLALDGRGRLWVAEAETYPKRLSLWNADGELVRAWYGGPKYGGGGAIDPGDRSRAFYAEYEKGGGLEFALDWEKGRSTVRSIFWRADRFPEFAAIPVPAPERAIHVGKWTYLSVCYNGQLRFNQDRGTVLWRLDDDHVARPVAFLINAGDLNHPQWGWPLRRKDAINALWRGKDPDRVLVAWADRDNDQEIEPGEISWVEADRKEIGLMPLVADDLSFTTSFGTRVAPPTLDDRGIPTYDLSKRTTVGLSDLQRSPLIGGDRVLTYRDGTDAFFGADLQGRHRWRFNVTPEDEQPRPGLLLGATRFNGPPVRPRAGEAGDLVAISGEKGTIYLLTMDGLFLQTLGGDERNAPLWRMPEWRRGMLVDGVSFSAEHFHTTITQLQEGPIYVVAGHEHSSLLKVEGLESVHRREFAALDVSADALRGLPETRVERARKQTRDRLDVAIVDRAPAVDGRLDDWPEGTAWAPIGDRARGAVLVAGDRLYAAFRTGDPAALDNAGGGFRHLFKTGGALDLMIGADPHADPGRRSPARGDLRLLVTRANGKAVAVLSQAVAPDAPEGEHMLYESPVGRVAFDRVAVVSGSVSLARHDGDFELSVPLSVLGLRPAPGREILGDLGLLLGDGAQTTRRLYWNNLDTGLVSDLPTEARLRPENWGVWTFGKK